MASKDSANNAVPIPGRLGSTSSAASDKTSAEVVMLRHFAGLTVPETAQAMGVSAATVDRHWRFARAWLGRRVYDDDGVHTVANADDR